METFRQFCLWLDVNNAVEWRWQILYVPPQHSGTWLTLRITGNMCDVIRSMWW